MVVYSISLRGKTWETRSDACHPPLWLDAVMPDPFHAEYDTSGLSESDGQQGLPGGYRPVTPAPHPDQHAREGDCNRTPADPGASSRGHA